MQRKRLEELQGLYAQAMATRNWNDVAIHSTEILLIDPTLAWLWSDRGVALQRLGHPLDAILNYDKALSLQASANAYNNKGSAYQELQKIDEALECFHKSLEINPEIAQTHMNIGHVHKWVGKNDLAIQAYRKCTELDPNYADGHLALAMLLLKTGQLEEGWKEYEWRWRTDQLPPRGLKSPQWDGKQDLTNKTILVYAEQGLGDIIQFGRYLRVLGNRHPRCKIIVEARQPVKRLLETVTEVYAVINYGEKVPLVDYVIPMMTLGALFTPHMHEIPAYECEYLLNYDDVETWGRRFAILPEGVKVGICWAGMSRMNNPVAAKIDEIRSASLDQLRSLAKVEDVMWISLQKGPPAEQIKAPIPGMKIADFTEDMYDFYETCCAIQHCDLVIAVDTAVCHAAASIGKPTWMLDRWDGCWRWFGDREDSPWYPSLRKFNQTAPFDWSGILFKMEEELVKFVAEHKNPT